ncbi:MAG TPA: hypothetical protein VHB18_12615 [Mycobacteriales bacterium]|jgi:hypothetical protein|nr:hypothetical protein [Mycobacteriales bacterium]
MRSRRVLTASVASAAALMLATAPAAVGVTDSKAHVKTAPVGSQLVGYSAIANAPGVGINGIYMGVSLDLPQASSSLTTGGVGAALASIAWPGDIGGNAGTAVLVLAPTAPSWVKILNDPVKAESHSTGTHHAINKTLPGTVMESSASHKLVTASSRTKLEVPALGSLGVFEGSSSAKLVGPHTIRSVADSAFSDISLAAGLIQIASLKSHAVVVSNGKTTHGNAATTVAGVKIAGIPVTIDKTGIHLSTSAIPTDAVTKLLTSTLKALHLKVTFTPSLHTKDGGAASFDAGALVLSYHPGASTYTITLGRAAAQVNATPSLLPDAFTPPPVSTGSPSTAPGAGGGGSVDLPGGDSSLGPTDDQPPSVAHRVVNQAKSILLAGGPTGAMIFGLVAATLLCAFLLPMIAGRFLDVPADAGCEEDE